MFCQHHIAFEDYAGLIDQIAQSVPLSQCPYVFEMVSGLKCKSPIPKKVFSSYQDLAFENRVYMAVEDTDLYLTKTFGDYMKLPPVENRVSHHSFTAYWK